MFFVVYVRVWLVARGGAGGSALKKVLQRLHLLCVSIHELYEQV